MQDKLPNVVEVEELSRKLALTMPVNCFDQLTDRERGILKILVHTATSEVEDIVFRQDGSIWVRPGTWKDGSKSHVVALLSDLHDRRENMRSVRDGDLYRLGYSPFHLMEKIAKQAGCRTHKAARLDTARLLEMHSVDDLSYPFYHAVRNTVFSWSPFDDTRLLDPSANLQRTIPGLALPSLTKADHPNRLAIAIYKRRLVIDRLLAENASINVDTLDPTVRDILLHRTNVYWWFGYEAELAVIEKLCRKGVWLTAS